MDSFASIMCRCRFSGSMLTFTHVEHKADHGCPPKSNYRSPRQLLGLDLIQPTWSLGPISNSNKLAGLCIGWAFCRLVIHSSVLSLPALRCIGSQGSLSMWKRCGCGAPLRVWGRFVLLGVNPPSLVGNRVNQAPTSPFQPALHW